VVPPAGSRPRRRAHRAPHRHDAGPGTSSRCAIGHQPHGSRVTFTPQCPRGSHRPALAWGPFGATPLGRRREGGSLARPMGGSRIASPRSAPRLHPSRTRITPYRNGAGLGTINSVCGLLAARPDTAVETDTPRSSPHEETPPPRGAVGEEEVAERQERAGWCRDADAVRFGPRAFASRQQYCAVPTDLRRNQWGTNDGRWPRSRPCSS